MLKIKIVQIRLNNLECTSVKNLVFFKNKLMICWIKRKNHATNQINVAHNWAELEVVMGVDYIKHTWRTDIKHKRRSDKASCTPDESNISQRNCESDLSFSLHVSNPNYHQSLVAAFSCSG